MPQIIWALKSIPLKKEYKKIDGKKHVVPADGWIPEGVKFQIEDEETVIYNHKEEIAYCCDTVDGNFYILKRDMGYNPVYNYGNLWHFEEMKINGRKH